MNTTENTTGGVAGKENPVACAICGCRTLEWEKLAERATMGAVQAGCDCFPGLEVIGTRKAYVASWNHLQATLARRITPPAQPAGAVGDGKGPQSMQTLAALQAECDRKDDAIQQALRELQRSFDDGDVGWAERAMSTMRKALAAGEGGD